MLAPIRVTLGISITWTGRFGIYLLANRIIAIAPVHLIVHRIGGRPGRVMCHRVIENSLADIGGLPRILDHRCELFKPILGLNWRTRLN